MSSHYHHVKVDKQHFKGDDGRNYGRRKKRWYRQHRHHSKQWRLVEDGHIETELDHKFDAWEGRRAKPASTSASASAAVEKKSSRKDFLSTSAQDSHGRLWLYDHEPKKGDKPFYWKLEIGRFKAKPGIVQAAIQTSKGRVTHYHDKETMKLLLKKVSRVYRRLYGGKSMHDVIYPTSGVKK